MRFLQYLPHVLNEEQVKIVKLLVEDPKYIKPSGKANINALAKDMGRTWNEVSKLVKEIASALQNEL